LHEPFAPAVTNYTAGPVQLPFLAGQTTTTVTATAKYAGAKITIQDVQVGSGIPSPPIPLVFCADAIDVVVTPASGSPVHYSIAINGYSIDYIKASNTRPGAEFGMSVSLSGDTLAVGSPGESSGASGVNGDQSDRSEVNAGAAYVYARTEGSWKQ